MIFEIKHVNRMRPMLRHLVLLLFSLYVLNAIGAIESLNGVFGSRRYLNFLWLCLFIFFLSWKEIDLSVFKIYFRMLLPAVITCLFLYVYHRQAFDLGYVKYALLFLLAGSVCSNAKNFNLRAFFVVGALSCVAIFLVALYQIDVLGYLVPNGDLNQNVFASMAMIIGSATFFAYLYPSLHHFERLLYTVCGSLAIWVALRTTCRTAYVTELILCFLFLYLARIKLRWTLKESALFVFLVLLSMVLVVVFSPSEAANKFSVISSQIYDYWYLDPQETTKTSVGARLVIWEVALFDIIPSHFLFGVGDVRQLDWINLITVANVDTDFWERILHFHNEGINIFVTGGLLLFLVSNWLLYKLFQAARGEPVLLCLLVGSVSWGVTEVAFFHKNYFFVFLSLWLLYECALHNDRNRRAS